MLSCMLYDRNYIGKCDHMTILAIVSMYVLLLLSVATFIHAVCFQHEVRYHRFLFILATTAVLLV